MNVIFAPEALEDLAATSEHITQHDPVAAATLIGRVFDMIHQLAAGGLDGPEQVLRSGESEDALEAIAIDMGKAYFSSAIHKVPNAVKKIVFDRNHVMGIAMKAVDQVRRNENARITRQGETSPLAKTRCMWFYSEENLPEKYQASFAELKDSELLTAKAWGMKELLRKLWSFKYKPAAGRFLSSFIRSAKAMSIAPIRKLGEMLADHRQNILTYIDHRVTSASCEGINSTIQAIKARGRGYRNRKNFKTAIYFALGGLDLYPRLTPAP